jgi:hypothetical protein
MTRDISGQNSGQIRDTRDINPVPTRDTRDKPPIGAVPCPGPGDVPMSNSTLSGLSDRGPVLAQTDRSRVGGHRG